MNVPGHGHRRKDFDDARILSGWGAPMSAESQRKYRLANPDAAREWSRANPDKVRLHRRRDHLKRAYGLTPEMFQALHTRQDGGCAVCAKDLPMVGHGVQVDHDHATGAIRGLLCGRCNLLLGMIDDDAERLLALHAAIADYLAAPPAAAVLDGAR